jgi:myxalamid-type polyketide synthase MxaE and MxaD
LKNTTNSSKHVQCTRRSAVLEARGPRPLLEHIELERVNGAASGVVAKQIADAPPEARRELLVAHVRERAAAVLGFADPLALDCDAGFFQMGMDSVMSIRLRGELERTLGCNLPPTLAFEQPSVGAMATWIEREVLRSTAAATADTAAPDAPQAPAPPPADPFAALSENEVAALLAAELAAAGESGSSP